MIAAEVDLHALAGDPRLPPLHALNQVLLRHRLLSPLSVAA
jgi:hypothetical protein